jgi:mono/diheme cytochrome c family protein
MKKTVWVAFVVLMISALILAACGGGGGSTSGSGKQRQNPPSDYANAKNPFEGQADAATAGKDLFVANCSSCHGQDAKGDGPAGASLDPKPANLQQTTKEVSAQYEHWVVSEGGAAAGLSSAMPAFKGALSEEDIWKVVTYLKATYK